MAKAKTTKKDKNEKSEKVQRRINLDPKIDAKLVAVAGAKGIKPADYINDLLKDKFQNISKKSSWEQMEKV